MKRCNACKIEKPLDAFNRCSSRPDGRQYRCIECVKEYSRARYPKVRELEVARTRRWNEANPGRYRKHKADWQRRYLKAHPEIAQQRNRIRRARVAGAAGTATVEQVKARVEMYGGCCWMCGKPADSIDHVIPLARGGSDWPANLRPACRSCNSRKSARPIYKTPEAA